MIRIKHKHAVIIVFLSCFCWIGRQLAYVLECFHEAKQKTLKQSQKTKLFPCFVYIVQNLLMSQVLLSYCCKSVHYSETHSFIYVTENAPTNINGNLHRIEAFSKAQTPLVNWLFLRLLSPGTWIPPTRNHFHSIPRWSISDFVNDFRSSSFHYWLIHADDISANNITAIIGRRPSSWQLGVALWLCLKCL